MSTESTGDWRKSSRSGHNGACVETRLSGGVPQFRDSKLGDDSPILTVTRADHASFLAMARR